ncbi:MAG TPA: ATP-binding protein, partial [Candidatus Saccharimonadia bacterium]|nr:ATP-binding protein [Candidatus Saccharimonadia bacterium]
GRHGSWGQGPWGRRRPRTAQRLGCTLIAFIAFGAVLMAAVAWAYAGLSGAGSGVGVVVGLAILLLVVLVLVSSARWLRGLTEPVDDLVAAAGRVEAGDLDVQVTERGPREARALARAFNQMSARLAVDERERRGFLADVTHELRTPLAVVRANVEAIADDVYPADPAHLAPILDAITTLERLVDDLRTVAQAEAGGLTLHREPIDVAGLLIDAVSGVAAAAAERHVQITADVPDELPTIEADPVRLAQVVGNLLANALRHAPIGGHVVLSASADTSGSSAPGIAVIVQDDGPGFPADLLPHAFDRFVKGVDSPGAGLGLAIARDLVIAHGGTLEARNLPAGGAEVRLTLPGS